MLCGLSQARSIQRVDYKPDDAAAHRIVPGSNDMDGTVLQPNPNSTDKDLARVSPAMASYYVSGDIAITSTLARDAI